ncbi:aurora kinase C-like [Bacillus rossius redtenbacheri]|uniref:aurora kinase C-like n=1 Tax=Bacillus rossius redtenbacheri TaxID=93214 RepID=UPI002FDD2BC6
MPLQPRPTRNPEEVPEECRQHYLDLCRGIERSMELRKGRKLTIDDFEIGFPLGRGKFGRVYLARDKISHYVVALKILFKKELRDCKMAVLVAREIEIQAHLHHPRILELLTYFHDAEKIYLVLEYAPGGELYKFMNKMPSVQLPQELAAKFVHQVASALQYCHQNNVMHRDIKPENLLLDIQGNIKVSDFGWSCHSESNRRNTMCGTLDYLPPEMVESKQYSYFVDNWCLGVLLYEFLVGKPPFESENDKITYKRISNVDIRWPPHIPPGAKDLISKLLVHTPSKRLSLEDVMRHPWVVQNKDKAYYCLKSQKVIFSK